VECLQHRALSSGKNLVVSLPTAAGKSFIAGPFFFFFFFITLKPRVE